MRCPSTFPTPTRPGWNLFPLTVRPRACRGGRARGRPGRGQWEPGEGGALARVFFSSQKALPVSAAPPPPPPPHATHRRWAGLCRRRWGGWSAEIEGRWGQAEAPPGGGGGQAVAPPSAPPPPPPARVVWPPAPTPQSAAPPAPPRPAPAFPVPPPALTMVISWPGSWGAGADVWAHARLVPGAGRAKQPPSDGQTRRSRPSLAFFFSLAFFHRPFPRARSHTPHPRRQPWSRPSTCAWPSWPWSWRPRRPVRGREMAEGDERGGGVVGAPAPAPSARPSCPSPALTPPIFFRPLSLLLLPQPPSPRPTPPPPPPRSRPPPP